MHNLNLLNSRRQHYLRNLILGILCLFSFNCFAQSGQDKAENISIVDYPALHPQYREWATPGEGIEVSHNPPILLWPAKREKGVTYDIRLSQDLAFDEDHATIRARGIPWTIFNPHRSLASGVWHWQYRVHNGNWSDVLQFRVPSNSEKVISPPASVLKSSIPPDTHPRVLMRTKQEQKFIREVGQTEDAKIIINKADNMLDATIPEKQTVKIDKTKKRNYKQRKRIGHDSKHLGFNALSGIRIFSKAYILTGDKRYASRGIQWAKRVASWDPKGISGFNDFGDAACMLSMALAFDTFHNQLTDTDKQLLLKQIAVRGDGFYNYWINNIDAKVLSNHVWQFIFDYFFQTAIAVHGELKKTNDWLTYLYELWLARSPVLGGEDGGWANGPSYFRINMQTLLDVPMFIKEYTGFDFINTTKWYAQNPYWMYYSFPPGSSNSGFGDNAETITSPHTNYLAYADALSKLTGSKMAATYAHEIEQTKKINLSDANMFRWFRLRYLRHKKRSTILSDSLLPSSKVFRDIGVVDMHSDITNMDKNLMIAMRSSPYGSYGHMLADHNTFNVLYGGRPVFYLSGHKVAMKDPHRLGWYKATVGHNGILIDHKGQSFGPEGYGWIPKFINGKSMTYAVGDASKAYNSPKANEHTGLKHFRRHILLIRPNIILIYDELSADHKADWSWLIHSPHEIHIDESKNILSSALPNVTVATKLFASEDVRWKLTNEPGVPVDDWKNRNYNTKDSDWNLTAKTLNNAKKMRFLAIMQFDTVNEKKIPVHFDNNQKEIIIGKWIIKAEMDTSKPGIIQVYRKDGGVSFSSSGNLANKKSPSGRLPSFRSAKLAEFVDGEWSYLSASDTLPAVTKQIPATYKAKGK